MTKSFQHANKGDMLLSWLAFVLSALLPLWASANNVNVSAVDLTASTAANSCRVGFNISWDNSWRNVVNYDAVWVFVKYSTDSGVTWHHATMKTAGLNPVGFLVEAGTNLDILVSADKKGAFLQRPAVDQSQGQVASEHVRLIWDWGADGLLGTETVKVMVFACEMVYIPQGSFWAGSNGSGANEFILTSINTATAFPSMQIAPDPSWPNGYPAFYAMRYEISQGLYCDFLNSLTGAQSANRCSASSVGDFMCNAAGVTSPTNRNGIEKQAGGFVCNLDKNNITNGASIACNWLSWADLAAFADWAALRPMTELEYEKACRGTSVNVPNEYPWGSATNCRPARGIAYDGYTNETPTNASNYANCNATNHPYVRGPMRCGAFAGAFIQSTRREGGSGYYGNMELAGNLWERCVTIGHATGRAYTGLHGDGVLTIGGDANTANWPGTDAVGAGARGGSWQDEPPRLMTSDRQNAFVTDATRTATYGGRCVRTAP